MGQSRPLFLFIFVFSTCHDLNSNLNWKKCRWCAWDLNPGWHYGRRERIHWATAAPEGKVLLLLGRESWFSGYGWRLAFERSWIRIPVLYTGWTFFTLICCKKLYCLFEKTKINKKEVGVGPFKKIVLNSFLQYPNRLWIVSEDGHSNDVINLCDIICTR